ncbi:hypothetical protein ACH4PR_47960 [Streptomyces mirabilis]|uniref:hypothetical protein n=1 Tax=Streptomyces mirabilis TaxID=68239 RepID=UPI0037996A1E
MWQGAGDRGIGDPDWTGATPPGDWVLSFDRYRALRAERVTCVHLALYDAGVEVAAPPGSVIRLWDGATTTPPVGAAKRALCSCPRRTRPACRRATAVQPPSPGATG